MKQKHLNRLCAGALITLLAGGFSSCMEKDLFDPEYGKNQLLPKEEYFNFELVGDVKLSVDYKAAGYNNVFFMVFSENPVVTPGKLTLKEGIQPIYSAFTGKDGKYEGVMPIPTAVKEMWIYTNRLGVSGCAKMNLAGGVATYDAAANSAVGTRAKTSDSQLNNWFNTSMPYSIAFGRYEPQAESLWTFNYSSVVKWGAKGDIFDKNGANVYAAKSTENGSLIADISKRATAFLGPKSTAERQELLRDASVLNVTTTGDNTELQVVFLDEAAAFHNVFGYYYYKKGSSLATANYGNLYECFKPVKKYVLFPNLSKTTDEDNNGALVPGTAVKLEFFGENGDQPATDKFPEGYVIGWFLMSNGFEVSDNSNHPQYSIGDAGRISDPYENRWGPAVTSNDINYAGMDCRRFISLYDETSKSLVIGVEDRIGANSVPDDYCDLTFIVTSNKDLKDDNKPSIPDKPKEPEVWTASGTLAFEDMWPKGGDYDLNDVVVEYERVITYSEDNVAISAEEKFTFKQDVKAADNDDYFAYVAKLGTASVTADFTVETVTNSLIINKSAKEIVAGSGSKTFTVTRTFAGSGVTKDQVIADFEPYIIIGDRGQNRKEVHLPLHSPTSKCDVSNVGVGQDAYYIDFATGLYPFAINIPTTNFVQVTERKRIDAEGEYPNFKAWAESNGSTNTEWYNTGKGNK